MSEVQLDLYVWWSQGKATVLDLVMKSTMTQFLLTDID